MQDNRTIELTDGNISSEITSEKGTVKNPLAGSLKLSPENNTGSALCEMIEESENDLPAHLEINSPP